MEGLHFGKCPTFFLFGWFFLLFPFKLCYAFIFWGTKWRKTLSITLLNLLCNQRKNLNELESQWNMQRQFDFVCIQNVLLMPTSILTGFKCIQFSIWIKHFFKRENKPNSRREHTDGIDKQCCLRRWWMIENNRNLSQWTERFRRIKLIQSTHFRYHFSLI